MRAALDILAALTGAYLAALGVVLLWFWQCAAQGVDPWTTPRSAR